jgi:outer membrane biosynthesis protein TonB
VILPGVLSALLAVSIGCHDEKSRPDMLTIDSVQKPLPPFSTIPTPVERNPILTNPLKAGYPKGILNTHTRDTVWIIGWVDTVGNFSPLRVSKSSDNRLDSTAMRISSQLKFTPAESGGTKIRVQVLCRIPFGK